MDNFLPLVFAPIAAAGPPAAVLDWIVSIATWIAAIAFLALTIFIHELGHFLAARWRGLVVERFSIGFGPRIWSRMINGVEWRLSAIPLGGYVALPQLAPMEVIEGSSDTGSGPPAEAHPGDKIIVAFAGPLFSLLLALATALGVWIVGRPSHDAERSTVVGYVLPDSPAAMASLPLQPGDRILAVDNKPVTSFGSPRDSVIAAIVFSRGDKIQFDIERTRLDGAVEIITTLVRPRQDEITELREVGIMAAERLFVGQVMANSPAAGAGLEPGDELLRLDGRPMFGMHHFIDYISNHGGRSVALVFRRGGAERTAALVPEIPSGTDKPKIGIEFGMSPPMIVHPGPLAQIGESAMAVVDVIRALTTPRSPVGIKHLVSPIGMVDSVSRLVDVDLRLVLWYAVLINVNLALLNILPIPVLDGGHITFSIIEWIRRRPLPAQLIQGLQSAFAVLLIAFMFYVMIHDTRRVVRQRQVEHQAVEKARHTPAIEFLPEPKPAANP